MYMISMNMIINYYYCYVFVVLLHMLLFKDRARGCDGERPRRRRPPDGAEGAGGCLYDVTLCYSMLY